MRRGVISKWMQQKLSGFIRPDDNGGDLFFRKIDVCNWEQIEFLAAGMVVEYRPAANPHGPCAYHVFIVFQEAA